MKHHAFVTSAVNRVERSAIHIGRWPPGKKFLSYIFCRKMEKPSLEVTQEYAIPGVWKTVLLGPRQIWSCSGARHVGGRGKQQFSSAVDALPNWAVDGGEWKALRPGLFTLGEKKFSPSFEYAAGLFPGQIWTSLTGRIIDCLCRKSIRDHHYHRPRVLQPHSHLILLYLLMYSEDYRLLTYSYYLFKIPFKNPNRATGFLLASCAQILDSEGQKPSLTPILRFQVMHFSVLRYLLFYISERFPVREI